MTDRTSKTDLEFVSTALHHALGGMRAVQERAPQGTAAARYASELEQAIVIVNRMQQDATTDVTRDARRYRRLQVLGCAVMNTSQFAQGLVSRWTNLDAIVDADLKAHPSRGENSSLEPACLCARRNEQIVETHLVCPIHSMKASEQCPEQWKDFYGYVRCRLPAGHEGPHGPSEKAK